MFAGDEEGAPVVTLTEQVSGTKIAVFHPQITGLNGVQKQPEQRAFLRIAIFTRKDIGDQAPGGLIDPQRCAGQDPPFGFVQLFDAMRTGFAAVAINNLNVVALKPKCAMSGANSRVL